MIDRIADWLTHLAVSRRRAILWGAALLALLSVVSASRLRFNPDILSLIPQHDKEVNDFRHVLETMGTLDQHIVVVRIPPGRQVEDYEPLVESLARRYRALPTVADVQYRLPNPLDLMDQILPRVLLLLTPAELDRVATALSDAQIEQSVRENRQTLRTPQGIAAQELVKNDPFRLLPIFLDKFRPAGGGFKLDTSSGYFLSADHTTLLMLVQPRRPAQDIPFGRRFMAQARRVERAARADLHAQAPDVPAPGIGYTGGYAISLYDAELIQKDVIYNVAFSCVAVLALFLYAFRRPAALLYAGVPMLLAVVGTFGLAGLVFGQLSSSSAAFGALVAGLGVDFITVLYGRYAAERGRGAEPAAAIRGAYRSTLYGVFFAALTTAATFYSYLFTEFKGMSELGVLTGTGILIFLVCVLFLLPALLMATDGGGPAKGRLELRSFGSDRLVRQAIAHPRATVLVWIVVVAVCAALMPGLKFSDNIENLRAKGNEGVTNQALVTSKFGQSFGYMMYVVEAKDLEGVLRKTQAATVALQAKIANGPLSSIQSIGSFLPPQSQQMEILARLRAGQGDTFSFDRIAATLHRALAANGFRPDVYDPFLKLFGQALNPPGPVGPEDIHDERLAALLRRFLKRTDQGYISVIYLYPKGGSWHRFVPKDLVALADDQGAILTGVNRLSSALRTIVRQDATRSTLLGFVLVFAMFSIAYRSLKWGALAFVPFLAGAVGMLGLMSLLRLEFNFINVYVGLFLVGVATDYAIYMLQRYLEDPESFAAGAPETGRAVVMAALTCIVGFGSFALSHYPGLRSIGYASTFGVTASCLAAITLLPALLAWRAKK
ncbi:MAG TPA: MMPL family transporter [Thermoanaerobaculia bacterium]|nr:MMPL family transporter [Thermoanaerobaculia bacterium]